MIQLHSSVYDVYVGMGATDLIKRKLDNLCSLDCP